MFMREASWFGHDATNMTLVSTILFPKISPHAILVANLVGREVPLVLQRSAAGDKVAQVQERQLTASAFLEQAQDIEGAERQIADLGVVEEVDRRHARGEPIRVADAD